MKRKSFLKPRCTSCILGVAYKYLLLGLDQQNLSEEEKNILEEQGVKQLIHALHKKFSPTMLPNEVASSLFRLAAEASKNEDPWIDIRKDANQSALEVLPIFQEMLDELDDPKDRLFFALQGAVLGNILDTGTAGHHGELDVQSFKDQFAQIQGEGFRINDFDKFYSSLKPGKELLYLLDNAGEIVFDKLVIQELVNLGIKVTAAVKGGPISNDAIYADVQMIGLEEICPVVTTGSADLGYDPQRASEEFLALFRNSDIILMKGQANWECIYSYQHLTPQTIKYFILFRIKCQTHAELINLPEQSSVFMEMDLNDPKFC